MSDERATFLDSVRHAVTLGNQAGRVAPHPGPWHGYRMRTEGDLAAVFAERCAIVGGQCHRVRDGAEALDVVDRLLKERKARRIVIGQGPYVDALDLPSALRGANRQWCTVAGGPELEELAESPHKAALFAADVGITGVDWLVAEAGSIALLSSPGQARSLSLLPPIHVAVAHRSQLLADLFDLFDILCRLGHNPDLIPGLPACVNLITGPSKTGDIELKLVTGVHGPAEVHVVLIDQD